MKITPHKPDKEPAHRRRVHYLEPPDAGLTLIELLIVFSVLLILAAVVVILPALASRPTTCRLNCTNNQKQIGLSFKTWSIDNNDRFPMQVSTNEGGTKELITGPAFVHFVVMSNELSTARILLCPNETKRTWATNFTSDLSNSKISYFVGLDATDTNATLFLTGDRNITNGIRPAGGLLTLTTNRPAGWTEELHRSSTNRKTMIGNLALSDGSVHQVGNLGLRQALQASGQPNRLALP
jgi:competence protein ComGC